MSSEPTHADPIGYSTRRLSFLYARALAVYLGCVALLWFLGVEAIYEHITPFYALWKPVFPCLTLFAVALFGMGAVVVGAGTGSALRPRTALFLSCAFLAGCGALAYWERPALVALMDGLLPHLRVIVLLAVAFAALRWALPRMLEREDGMSRANVAKVLAGLVLFAFLFAGATAMLRGGLDGISQAFARTRYEPSGDIGAGGSIWGLFHDFMKLLPHLSQHSGSHPPAPIALLWLFSYVVGREPLGLSLAVMFLGALGVVPLYLWTRDMTDSRTALYSSLMYTVVPSIVLFSATSMDIVFLFFSLWGLFLFERALLRRSVRWAVLAGLAYAWMSLLHFSLLTLGAYFGLMGLYRISAARKERRAEVWNIARTAFVMLAAFVGLHLLVYWWSGFNIVECFMAVFAHIFMYLFPQWVHLAPSELSGVVEDMLAPRFSAVVWKFLNPVCWIYYAGIPVSVLFYLRLRHPEAETRGRFILFATTIAALAVLYLAKGEGERSAMYAFPFAIIPAAHLLQQVARQAADQTPLYVTLAFLAFQAWLTESMFYTYW